MRSLSRVSLGWQFDGEEPTPRPIHQSVHLATVLSVQHLIHNRIHLAAPAAQPHLIHSPIHLAVMIHNRFHGSGSSFEQEN